MPETTAQNNKVKLRLQCPMPKLDFDRFTMGHGKRIFTLLFCAVVSGIIEILIYASAFSVSFIAE